MELPLRSVLPCAVCSVCVGEHYTAFTEHAVVDTRCCVQQEAVYRQHYCTECFSSRQVNLHLMYFIVRSCPMLAPITDKLPAVNNSMSTQGKHRHDSCQLNV
eukprot:15519-Heterococcus_DN1.PRE.2